MKAKCNNCGFEAEPREFHPCMTPYHDLRCPKCGTTNVDTSEIKAAEPNYGYGNDNVLRLDEAAPDSKEGE